MTKKENSKTFIIPKWAIPCIRYGEYKGLCDERLDKVDTFLLSLPEGILLFNEKEYFNEKNHIDDSPAICVNAYIVDLDI